MALPNPTSVITTNLSLASTDLTSSAQILNHVLPAVSYKAVEIQHLGYFNIPINTGTQFAPLTPLVSFGVVFVRNLGGQGSGNVNINLTPTGGVAANVVNLDVGGVFLYISPALSSITVATIQPGIVLAQFVTSLTTSSNLEVLLAG